MVNGNFLAFGFQNPVLIAMVLISPNTNITVINVANELFPMADLKIMGIRTTGKTIDIAMLF